MLPPAPARIACRATDDENSPTRMIGKTRRVGNDPFGLTRCSLPENTDIRHESRSIARRIVNLCTALADASRHNLRVE
jgi:hypothetical protein